MAKVIKAPKSTKKVKGPSIFLAGSIDMGAAIEWQNEFARLMEDVDVTIFNPRRDDFDPKMEQDISNPKFVEQVVWELDQLDAATIICCYFDPKGKAPITMMELGLHAHANKLIVCCPEGFWRRANIQIVCERYGIPMADGLAELVEAAKIKLQDLVDQNN